jgi:maleylacetate reductase
VTTGFAYSTRAIRVVFGAGAFERTPEELKKLGSSHAYLIATPGRRLEVETLTRLLGSASAGSFLDARVHVPTDTVTRAMRSLESAKADALVSIGGGSAIGLAKALARERSLPICAIPTTYSGSEMTEVWGTTSGNEKRTGRDARVAPRLVIYDPALTLSLPAKESAASGMNAIAHSVEALYAPDTSPFAALLAMESIRLLATALPTVVKQPGNIEARSEALLGAHFAGQALQITTMGLHHRLCHALGGLGLPHALTHAILLPYTVAFGAAGAPEAMKAVATALGAADAVEGLHALKRRLGITQRLRDVGLPEEQIDAVARGVAPLASEADLRGILRAAF